MIIEAFRLYNIYVHVYVYVYVRFLKRKGDTPVAVKSMITEIKQLFQGKTKNLTVLERKHVQKFRTDGGTE